MNNNVNNEERKNNGQGIFYAVIGVATLVVTIIGSTFAYFSATANSAVDAVTAQSTTINLGYSEEAGGLHNHLIPMNESDALFKNEPGITASDCIDLNSNEICSTYQFTISNPSTTTGQQVYAYIIPASVAAGSQFSENLKFAIFKGAASDISSATNKFDVNQSATALASAVNGSVVVAKKTLGYSQIDLTELTQVIPANSSVTYTMVIWIHETNSDQTTADSGKNWAGQIKFTTQNGSSNSGVTGVLSAS